MSDSRPPSVPERAGLEVYSGVVLPEWIDVNDHMNVAYYVLAFDLAVDSVWHRFGITADYIGTQNNSTFAVEAHIRYLRELACDDPFIVTSQVLAFDAKRIHHFLRMYHAGQGYLAATVEWLNLHVDLDTRRVSPWPDAILDGIREFVAEQGEWPLPDEVGHQIRVAQPIWHSGGYGQ